MRFAHIAKLKTQKNFANLSQPRILNSAGFKMKHEIKIPETRHIGIVEHFFRAGSFYNAAVGESEGVGRFRLLMAAIYSCQAIVELMLECASRDELTIDRTELKKKIDDTLPYCQLIERLRIHDFHRYGLLPPPPNDVHFNQTLGPIKLKAIRGAAILQMTSSGPKVTCTGDSTVQMQRPLFIKQGKYLDPKSESYVSLEEVVHAFLTGLAPVVWDFETQLKVAPRDAEVDCNQPEGEGS